MTRCVSTASCFAFFLVVQTSCAADGNRLNCVDVFCDPYYPYSGFPKLAAPQFVSEEGGDAVAVAATEDTLKPLAKRAATLKLPPVPIGAAKIDITPDYPVRLSGYGSRKTESEGVAQKLWAKALAIGGDDGEGPAVLITLENCGMTPAIRNKVAKSLEETAKIRNERLAIAVSHSHTAPCLTNWAPYIFGRDIPPDQQARIDRYTSELTEKLVQVALDALKQRNPARLFWGHTTVDFAANRRVIKDGHWTGFGVQADGPVDHSLPVLVAKDEEGKLISIVANYACHCTTLGGNFNKIAGDWAGFAQDMIE